MCAHASLGIHVCTFCIFLFSGIHLDAVFSIFLVFLTDKLHISKREIHVMHKLFPNISNALEQIHIFETSIVA